MKTNAFLLRMTKRLSRLFGVLVCSVLLLNGVVSCQSFADDGFEDQEELITGDAAKPSGVPVSEGRKSDLLNIHEGYLKLAAGKLTAYYSSVLTPQSGSAFAYELNTSGDMYEDAQAGYVALRVVLLWDGRAFLKGIDYDRCKVGGWMYYYYNSKQVTFRYDNRNSHVIKISSNSDWKKLAKGVTIKL